MVKKSVLTPVLAGVLGVAVVGSGIGYVVLNKNNDKDKNKDNSISKVAEDINSTIDTAKKAVNGELDFAYDSNVKITFGDALTSSLGQEIKPIQLSTKTKQKGKNTAADFVFSYDDKNLISLNSVYSRDNDSAYAKVPELSDSYVVIKKDDIKSMLESELSAAGISSSAIDSFSADAANVDFDTDAFEKSLKEYQDTFKGALPEAKDGDKLSGDIDGNSYEYTTKTYSLTGADACKAIKAVAEKAKTDETLKKYYDESVKKAASASSSSTDSVPSYDELIDQIISSVDSQTSNSSETIDFDLYYDSNDKFTGFNVDEDGVVFKLVTINNSDVLGIDMNFDAGSGTAITINGAAKTSDNVTNGSYKIAVKSGSTSNIEGTLSLKDIKNSDGAFSGTIRSDINFKDDTEAFSGWVELTSNSTSDKTDLSVDIGANDSSYLKVEITGNKTEASDITVPSGDSIYNLSDENERNSYMQTINTEKFMTNLKDALGEDLYNKLFAGNTNDFSSMIDSSASDI